LFLMPEQLLIYYSKRVLQRYFVIPENCAESGGRFARWMY